MLKAHRKLDMMRLLLAVCLIPIGAGLVSPPQAAADVTVWPATLEEADAILAEDLPADATADDWARRAWTLSRYRSDHAAAAEAAAKAIELEPDHYKAHEIAGIIAQLQGRYDAAFEHDLKLVNPGRMESIFYLGRTDTLNLSHDQRTQLQTALIAAIANDANPPMYRAYAKRYLATLLSARGKLQESGAQWRSLNPITDWMIIGPFRNEENAGFSQEYGPETEIDYTKKYQGRDREVGWTSLRHLPRSGTVDFDTVMYPNTQVLAYAVTYVHVDEDTNAVAHFGAGTAVKLWVNDQLLFADDEDVAFTPDQYDAACTLKAGWNKVLVKVCERKAAWCLLLRFTAPDGTPLALKTDASVARETPNAAEADKPAFDFAGGLHEHFRTLHEKQPDDPAITWYLAQAATATGRKMDAVALCEEVAAHEGECSDLQFLLARAYLADERPEKALVTMKKALAIEPHHLECLAQLGRFYDNANLFEKALATLRKAVKANPDWPDAQYYLMNVYKGKGWEEHVWRQAKWLLEKKPDVPWVLSAYADQCRRRGFRKEAESYYKKVLTDYYDDLDSRASLISYAIEQQRLDDALALYDSILEIRPISIGQRMAKARLLMQYERYDDALKLCADALDICPENFSVHKLIGQIYQRQGKDEDAIAAWKKALEYNPDDDWMREYLEFLEPETIAAFEEYGIDDDTAEEIVANRVDPADYPKADAVVLLDHLVTQLNDDGSYTSLEHKIVQILNDSGRNQYTSMYVGGYGAKMKRAVVTQPDGSEIEATRVRGGSVEFGQLQIGSIIEVKAQFRGSANEWLSRHYTTIFRFQGGDPMLRSQFVLLVPESRSIQYYLQGDRAKLTQGEFEGHTVYDFLAKDIPIVEPESNRPPYSDILDLVRVSTIEDWDEIAQWEYSLVKDQFVADEAVREKVKELTADCSTREEKTKALAYFVMQKIQYRQDYDRAIMGMKPHKAGNVLEKEVGDCKDKANLLITMLREIGVDAHYVGLRTRPAGELIEKIPSNQCNHAIVYIPEKDDFSKGMWIDGTANYSGLDTLPAMDQDAEAMVFTENGEFVFMKTPTLPPDNTLNEYVLDVTLQPDGGGHVVFTINGTGQMATLLRRAFEAEGLRRQMLEQFANRYYPGSRVTSVEVSDLDNRDIPVKITCEFDAPNIAQVVGETMNLRLREFMPMTQRYANRSERTYDIWNAYTAKHRFVERFHLPEGYTPASMPEPTALDTPHFSFSLSLDEKENEVAITRELIVKVLDIPKEAYEQVRSFCIDADKSQREQVVLQHIADPERDAAPADAGEEAKTEPELEPAAATPDA